MTNKCLTKPSRILTAAALVATTIGSTALAATASTVPVADVPAVQAATGSYTGQPIAVQIGTNTHRLDATDRLRGVNELVQYSPAFGLSTRTNKWGTEVVVVGGKITSVVPGIGNISIPAGGYVLSGHGTSAQWLKDNARVGMWVSRIWASTPTTTPTPTTPAPTTPAPTTPAPTTPAPTTPAPTDSYASVLSSVAGLTHYYPLDAANQARDLVGNVDGTVKGSGVSFTDQGAVFTGKGYVELPDNDDFSVATKGGLTVLVDLTVDSWKGAGASEYVHWMGKGVSGAHEWTFRHYVQGGSGEAPARQGRVSFYHFNPAGGLGAGSYFQDAMNSSENVVGATADMRQVQMFKNGALRDTDPLSGYNVTPQNTTTPVRIGSRGDNSGFLVGKIRRVAFFNRVLTPAEMQRLAAAATR